MTAQMKGVLAPRGDLAGVSAIRIWTMQLETAMIRRYIGNAPTLDALQKIASETLRKINGIKPKMVSNCPSWDHEDNCQCLPPPIDGLSTGRPVKTLRRRPRARSKSQG